MNSLEISQKELADLKDHLDGKKIERSELQMKQDVLPLPSLLYCVLIQSLLNTSASANNYSTRKRNSNGLKSTPRTSGWHLNKRSRGSRESTRRCLLSDVITINRWSNFGRKLIRCQLKSVLYSRARQNMH